MGEAIKMRSDYGRESPSPGHLLDFGKKKSGFIYFQEHGELLEEFPGARHNEIFPLKDLF